LANEYALVFDHKWHGATCPGFSQHALGALSKGWWWLDAWHR